MRNLKLLLYVVCKAFWLFRIAQWLTRKQLRILCYHGFAMDDEAAFRPSLFISPEQFGRRLEAIGRYGYDVLPLTDAITKLYADTLPLYPIAITVDDGLYSFYRLAVPLLQRHAFPATVYVTTYYVEHANPVFRLVVQYMFWKTPKRVLSLRSVPWGTSQEVDLTNPEEAARAMWSCINYGEQECTEEMRCAICMELGEMLEMPYDSIVRSRILSLMSPDELRRLAAADVDIQLHTHRHTLPVDDEATARREIGDNRAAIRQWLGIEAKHFCYPSGIWHQRQWAWLESMNVESATVSDPGLNSRNTPKHALRRILDSEGVHQLEFEAHLSGFVSLLRSFMPRRGEHDG